MLLMERSLASRKQGAEQRRDAMEASQERLEKRAVDDMRKEADQVFAGALTAGLISIGGSAMQLAGAGMSAHAASLETKASDITAKAAEETTDIATDAAKRSLAEANSLKSTASRLNASASVLSAGNGVMAALSKGADGISQSSAKDRQADRTEHENAARTASRDAKRADETANELGELRQKTFARLEALLEAEQQARLAVIQRM
ncbi:MAG: hypothetical protein KF764_12470 [Labilithrix sp.]|nr:hypothetical protein [Labilithrix sp.]MBX3221526.1 hypothetical protein [Labilithrix sp.]